MRHLGWKLLKFLEPRARCHAETARDGLRSDAYFRDSIGNVAGKSLRVKVICCTTLSPVGPVQSPVLDGFSDMLRFNSWHRLEIGNGASHETASSLGTKLLNTYDCLPRCGCTRISVTRRLFGNDGARVSASLCP